MYFSLHSQLRLEIAFFFSYNDIGGEYGFFHPEGV